MFFWKKSAAKKGDAPQQPASVVSASAATGKAAAAKAGPPGRPQQQRQPQQHQRLPHSAPAVAGSHSSAAPVRHGPSPSSTAAGSAEPLPPPAGMPVEAVERRLTQVRDEVLRPIDEMLSSEPSLDMVAVVEMLLGEVRPTMEELQAGQAAAEVCIAADRFDLVESLSTLTSDLQDVEERFGVWKRHAEEAEFAMARRGRDQAIPPGDQAGRSDDPSPPAPNPVFEQDMHVAPDVASRPLVPGMRVRAVGLSDDRDLNGRDGVLQQYNQQEAKWQVILDGGFGLMLNADNLEIISVGDPSASETHITGTSRAAVEVNVDTMDPPPTQTQKDPAQLRAEAEDARAVEQLEQLRKSLSALEQGVDEIHRLYHDDKIRTNKARDDLAQLEARLDKLQCAGIDTIEISAFESGGTARQLRKQLTKDAELLHDRLHQFFEKLKQDEADLRNSMEVARQAAEEEEARWQAMEDARLQAEEEDAQRRVAEAEAAKRRHEEELARLEAEEEERFRIAEEEEEARRIEEEEAQRVAEAAAALRAEEEERARRREEEMARRQAAEAEKERLRAEEAQRKAEVEEARRLEEQESAIRRAKEEAEARRQEEQRVQDIARRRAEEEEEARRRREQEERRKAEEEARRRQEEEEKRKAEEETRRRKEQEEKRKAEEETRRRKEQEEERRKAEAEDEARRRKEQEERRKAEEDDAKRRQAEKRAEEELQASRKREADEARRKAALAAFEEAERREREEAERRQQEEAERKLMEQAQRDLLEEAERRAKMEVEQKSRDDAARKTTGEATRWPNECLEKNTHQEAERRFEEEESARRQRWRRIQQEAERRLQDESMRKKERRRSIDDERPSRKAKDPPISSSTSWPGALSMQPESQSQDVVRWGTRGVSKQDDEKRTDEQTPRGCSHDSKRALEWPEAPRSNPNVEWPDLVVAGRPVSTGNSGWPDVSGWPAAAPPASHLSWPTANAGEFQPWEAPRSGALLQHQPTSVAQPFGAGYEAPGWADFRGTAQSIPPGLERAPAQAQQLEEAKGFDRTQPCAQKSHKEVKAHCQHEASGSRMVETPTPQTLPQQGIGITRGLQMATVVEGGEDISVPDKTPSDLRLPGMASAKKRAEEIAERYVQRREMKRRAKEEARRIAKEQTGRLRSACDTVAESARAYEPGIAADMHGQSTAGVARSNAGKGVAWETVDKLFDRQFPARHESSQSGQQSGQHARQQAAMVTQDVAALRMPSKGSAARGPFSRAVSSGSIAQDVAQASNNDMGSCDRPTASRAELDCVPRPRSATLHIRRPFAEIANDVESFATQFARAAANAAGVPANRIRVLNVRPGPAFASAPFCPEGV